MRDETISNSLVSFLRMLTSCEIELRAEFFAPFIMVRAARPKPYEPQVVSSYHRKSGCLAYDGVNGMELGPRAVDPDC